MSERMFARWCLRCFFVVVLFQVRNMEDLQLNNDPNFDEFETILLIAHYYAMRSACSEVDGMVTMCLRLRAY